MNIPHDMYIDGQWTGSSDDQRIDIVNPATLETIDSVPEAKGEIMATADQFDWCADETRRIYGRVIDGHSRAHRTHYHLQRHGECVTTSQ